jgi:hypothetical protein
MKRLHLASLAVLLISGVLFGITAGYAQTSGPAEYPVKAAFIYNFAKYVDWPAESFPSKDSPVTLCIFGRDPFGGGFGAIEGRQVHGRAFRVRRGVALDDVGGCNIAFVSDSEERRYMTVLKALAPLPILTMSDIDGFAEAGGAVGLFVAEDRLQFDANFATLQRANLKASSQALKLARTVYGMKR